MNWSRKGIFRCMLAIILAVIVSSLFVSCSGGKEKTIEYAEAALERSGVRDVFFEPDTFYEDQGVKPPKGYYPYSLHIREDKYYDKFNSLDNPDLRVQSPVYYLEWNESGHRFTTVKAEEGSFTDNDALTKGTLVFMDCDTYRNQYYQDQKGNHFYGTQESVRVYLYDLSSEKFIADKKFYGAELKDEEHYSGSGNSFRNNVDRRTIDEWVNSLR